MTRVLVTDGHELAGLATARSVGRGGFEVVVAVPPRRDRGAVARSRWVSEVVESPDPWEESGRFEEWLGAQAESGKLGAVFPVSEASLVAAVALGGDAGLSGVPVVMPDASSRRMSLSKDHATRVAAEAGLATPVTVTWYADGQFDDAAIAGWSFPFLVKSDNCHTSVSTYRRGNTWMVHGTDELRVVRLALSGLACRAIAQQPVPGRGVSACVYAEDGVPLLTFGHRRMHEVPWTGGWSSLRAAHHDPELIAQGHALLAHARYTGLAMVELRQEGDGTAYFLEVNGRPWGSLALALHAGADFPLLALQRTLARSGGRSDAPAPSADSAPAAQRSLVCMNLVPGELDHLRSVVRSSSLSTAGRLRLLVRQTASVVRWLVDPRTRHDHLWWSDPRPGFVQARRLLGFGATAIRGAGRVAVRRVRPHPVGHVSPSRPAALPGAAGAPVRSVLWICSGNVCRSPFTGLLFAALAPGIDSRSAGLHTPGGVAVPDWVRGFYDEHDVPWIDHRSQPITEDLVRTSDVIVGMEEVHRTELLERFPEAAGRTWLIGELGDLDGPEVADPYLAGAPVASRVYQQLAIATKHAAATLVAGGVSADRGPG